MIYMDKTVTEPLSEPFAKSKNGFEIEKNGSEMAENDQKHAL